MVLDTAKTHIIRYSEEFLHEEITISNDYTLKNNKKEVPLHSLMIQKKGFNIHIIIALCLLLTSTLSATAGFFMGLNYQRSKDEKEMKLRPLPDIPGQEGIDVSRWQNDIDWQAVAKSGKVHFAYIKATGGTITYDSMYKRNAREARKAGMPFGAYHYLVDDRSIDQQFKEFTDMVKKEEVDLIPMLDVEIVKKGRKYIGVARWNKEQLQDSVAKFIDLCKKHYGKAPMIYSSQNFYNSKLSPRFDKYLLYIARYRNKKTGELISPQLLTTLPSIWQYSCTGKIPGIETNVDLCRLEGNVTVEMLRK